MDDKIKQLLQDLGTAINESISGSDDVSRRIQKIRDEGYDLYVVLDATIGLNKQDDEDSAPTASPVDALTNIPKELRASLAENFTIDFPKVVEVTPPAPDGSRKYLFALNDGNRIESVYMPMGDRTSVCLSSQAGCAVGCTFCVTGFFGAGRNLIPSEMLGQFFTIAHEHAVPLDHMNVVFMGMGEPLLNLDNVVTTLDVLYRSIAPKRITVSTSGIIPGIED